MAMVVEKSDIDQLVLGYVAEERYFQTRNELFRESPNLPERVPILSVFGDISSENRLHTILQEYVQFKTRQLVPMCAACSECDSLPDMWKVFDRIVSKIRSYKPPEPPSLSTTCAPNSSASELRCYSPSYVWQGTSKGKTNNGSGNSDPMEHVQRMKLNHLNSEYETDQSEIRIAPSAGSAKRKKSTVPKKITNFVPAEPYARNGDLSLLLQTSDKNDALALVGVQILSNMKRCADKCSSVPCSKQVDEAAATPVNPTELSASKLSSCGTALDIDDLISHETRSGLVEMTIDSLLNPSNFDKTVSSQLQSAKAMPLGTNVPGDFSELRKLLEFDDVNSNSNLTLPDLAQIQEDERELMAIIKSDDMLEMPGPLPIQEDSSNDVSGHSQDEKCAVAGLLDMHCPSITDKTGSPHSTSEHYGRDRSVCTTPKILNIRSEKDQPATTSRCWEDETLSSADKNGTNSPLKGQSKSSLSASSDLPDNCASMPPKKRFLVKETRTPEKHPSNQSLSNKKDCCYDGNSAEKNSVPKDSNGLGDIISAAASLSNLEMTCSFTDACESSLQIVTSPETSPSPVITDANVLNVELNQQNSNAESVPEVDPKSSSNFEPRRSKRLKKPNLVFESIIHKSPVVNSKGRKSPASTPKKKQDLASCKKTPTKVSKFVNPTPSPGTSSSIVTKAGQGAVVVKLKDCIKMPVAVSGIVVRSDERDKLSRDDIINTLVGQVQKEKSERSKATPISCQIASSEELNGTETRCTSGGLDSVPSVREKLHIPEIRIQAPTPQPPAITSPSSAPQSPPTTSRLNNTCAATLSFTSPATCVTPEPPHLVSCLMNQDSRASSYMPISEESLMAALDMPFLPQGTDNKSTNERSSETPSKTDLQQFSTISPGGIFSVLGQVSPVEESRVSSAKTNLLNSFSDKKNVNDTLPTIPLTSSSGLHTSESTKLHEVTANVSSNPESTDSSLSVTHTPVLSAPVVGLKQTDLGDASKAVPSTLKKKGKAKLDLGKQQPLLHKRPRSGILLCSKMKNMIRIEPKRHGVPAVKRYIVQGGQEQNSIEQANAVWGSVQKSQTSSSAKNFGKNGAEPRTGESNTSDVVDYDHNTPENIQIPIPVPACEKKSKAEKCTPKKSKRKSSRGNSRDGKTSKRLKLSRDCGPVMKWTYNDIQSKLDAIHGERTKMKTPVSDNAIAEQRMGNKGGDEICIEKKSYSNVQKDGAQNCTSATGEDLAPEIRLLDNTINFIEGTETEQPRNHCSAMETKEQKNSLRDGENPDSSMVRRTEEPSHSKHTETKCSNLVLNISDESLLLPFRTEQIEPLDLSLSSWLCSSKSPFKNYAVSSNNTQCSVAVQKQCVGEDDELLNRDPLKEVLSENSKHQKSSKKKRSSKKFKRLEEKLKKVDLRNMDISKFLDSLDYHET